MNIIERSKKSKWRSSKRSAGFRPFSRATPCGSRQSRRRHPRTRQPTKASASRVPAGASMKASRSGNLLWRGRRRVLPLYSPLIDSITVVRRGKVRRAKLYYLRGLRGKAARIPERTDSRAKALKAEFKGFKRPKGNPDDLKLIKGLEASDEKRLNELGVSSTSSWPISRTTRSRWSRTI